MTERTLRELAADRGVDVGAAVDPNWLRDDPEYGETLGREFSMLTAENAHKWTEVHPEPHTYTFEDGDLIVSFAREHDMAVRGHTLCWHNQVPEWVHDRVPLEAEEAEALLREHAHTVAGHYHDDVSAWDVVNEAVDDDGGFRETLWYDALGERYLDVAFEAAADVAPDADLFYNDYGIDDVNEKSDEVYELLSDMIDRGVPVDGVGLQLHAIRDWPDPEGIGENVTRFRDLGLEVHVTEFDVLSEEGEGSPAALERQAEYYGAAVREAIEAGASAVVTWGVHDEQSWLHYRDWADEDAVRAPLLFDDEYQPKPAYDAVAEALSGE